MNKADEALQAVQRSNEAGKLKKDPPTKHLKEGNYARADYFEARVKELELEVMALQKEKQDLVDQIRIREIEEAKELAEEEALEYEEVMSKFKSGGEEGK